ncbi:hypothetical protein AB434_2072 [Heyndrickxia coagulans]|uniref:Uncharacterized protein n=1 Tax=Heyndrickxia coagulans TaxID=1398 RepID=A0AAN0WD18_HEYCO|nr:hypothetical protein SB48_HM08orf05206 [Heyndrickxia coagulans]AKN54477.1 hypothetical protein AB434_2072 [Heyndrickxia coagulans]KGB30724.1 hypothetical protein IE89_03335 [Heyndrickxia coagulans]KGT39469.1 hypothetical protein P421_04250 [Heyndrickxia coagulans P38]KXT19789.1 hypothetical protein UZ35_13080 [Heyndrickxia coagulans]
MSSKKQTACCLTPASRKPPRKISGKSLKNGRMKSYGLIRHIIERKQTMERQQCIYQQLPLF